MGIIDPMFHMDEDYMWRWYLTNGHGGISAMSVRGFFSFEEARRDYDDAMRRAA